MTGFDLCMKIDHLSVHFNKIISGILCIIYFFDLVTLGKLHTSYTDGVLFLFGYLFKSESKEQSVLCAKNDILFLVGY